MSNLGEVVIGLEGWDSSFTHTLSVERTSYISIEHTRGDEAHYFELDRRQARLLRDALSEWLEGTDG